MTNETHSGSDGWVLGKDSGVAAAIILPSLFALILLVLLTIACLLPRCTGDTPKSKEQRRKKRIECLDNTIKPERFVDWMKKERKLHPETSFTTILCVICLDEFDDVSQIRGLGCHHVFHKGCLDDWFGRWNEYCPLCHRPIIPGNKKSKKTERDRNDPPPVAFMV